MKALAKQLIQMELQEAQLRERLIAEDVLGGGYHPELRALHEGQADQVYDYVKTSGWPTLKGLGEEAYDCLFMVALNAISRPEWMRRAYLGFSEAVDSMAPGYAAYLSDRIAYFERRPQLFATQWDTTVEGETVLWPVEDMENLGLRRAKAGLDPFEDLDFSLSDLDLGQGLKRINGQYSFLYQVGWLCPSDREIKRLLILLGAYTSGGLMGPCYSNLHHKGFLSERKEALDMIMPLQHKEAFEDFVKAQGHTVVTRGLKHGLYALKDSEGFLELQVQFLPFEDHEDGWLVGGLDILLKDLQAHTVNGYLLSQDAILQGQARGLFGRDLT